MHAPIDWLSRLLDIMPVGGHLDLRCSYGAPWRIEQAASDEGEIAYHVVIGGSAVLEDPAGGPPQHLRTGDLLMLTHTLAHVLHDESGLPALPSRERAGLNVVISENEGRGERLDLLCGRFVLAPLHYRLLRDYLPAKVVVHASHTEDGSGTSAQLAGLVSLLRIESASESLGGRALLNGLSAAMFALALRLASEDSRAPAGLLAVAGHPRLAPALAAMFQDPARPWTLPDLADLCNMSRATMARQFRDKLGRSASELLTDTRMTKAASELKKTSASTGAVAEAVGYQSEAAFQRAFKQRMGMTPAQWRKSERGVAQT